MEWRLRDDFPATLAYHEHRERAPHLEQPDHRPRLLRAEELVREQSPSSVVDLGCGDGGLLSLIKDIPSWGYDFQPSNKEGWLERGIQAKALDVFNSRSEIEFAELVVMTEVLEHLANPHSVVEWVSKSAKFLVASSPAFERPGGPPDCHVWAWDFEGYEDLLRPYYEIIHHEILSWSQIIVGKSKYV